MSNEQPLQESDIIFPTAASSLNQVLGELKRSNLTITNRLQSIYADASFVSRVASAYKLPLVANERCGSWYIPPEHKHGSAYFKSTDGHFNQWAFSLRRLNLQLLDVLQRFRGCIIVDSTRRGKSMPDALSKAVPIWAAVFNRLLFPDDQGAGGLRTPEDVVSPSEHSQIEARLDEFVAAAASLNLDLNGLRGKLRNRPMRISWCKPDENIAQEPSDHEKENLIVLCTASSRESSERESAEYVQGAADDSESWALGLDATTFWVHNEELLSTSEDGLPQLIKLLVSAKPCAIPRLPKLIKPVANLWIGERALLSQKLDEYHILVVCSLDIPLLHVGKMQQLIHLVCAAGKVGSRQLRTELCKIDRLADAARPDANILVVGDSARDIAIGAALAILCKLYDQAGNLRTSSQECQDSVNKVLIKQRLSWIMISMPDATPSRTTLQSVNAYLMG